MERSESQTQVPFLRQRRVGRVSRRVEDAHDTGRRRQHRRNSLSNKGLHGLNATSIQPAIKQWSLYWMTDRDGALLPPVVGRFENGRGEFYGDDEDRGRPVRVRFIWSKITSSSAQWEQAFSLDQGQTWETNWIMEMTRIDKAGPGCHSPESS